MDCDFNAELSFMAMDKAINRYLNPKEITQILLDSINHFDEQVRKHEDTNEQWFLDFQDALNEISVR